MNDKLKDAIKRMEEKSVDFRTLDLGEKAFTAEDVARLSDVDPREICKMLIVKSDKGDICAVMLPGLKRLNSKKLRRFLRGNKIRMLRAEELRKEVGFEPGEVCPILIEKIPMIIDESVFETERINFGAGDLYYGIEIKSRDILKFVNARIEDIVE